MAMERGRLAGRLKENRFKKDAIRDTMRNHPLGRSM
jgi:hypothetical protein